MVLSFIKLRNELITSIMIRSIRMAQELTKFNIGEFKDIESYTQDGEKEYMIKVKKHKTMIYGGAEIIKNIWKKRL